MPKEVKGVIVSRLFVLISIIALPIAIFLIYSLADFSLWYSTDPKLTFIIVKVLCPTVFSISWFLFLVLFANRLSQTLESMDNTIRVVPLRLKFFFGINALVILFIFIFPAITPVVSALIFASAAWRLTTFRKQNWTDSKVSFGTKFLMLLFSLLPIFCAVSILPNYLTLAIFVFEYLWLPLLPWIFTISYCLSTSLAFGSLFFLMANNGISEYEQLYDFPQESNTILRIRVFEVLFFVFLLLLAIFEFSIVDLFYNVGFFLIFLVYLVNFFSGRVKNKSFKGYLFGYIIAGVFMGSNFFLFVDIFSEYWTEVLRVLCLSVSAALFIYVFFYTFIKMEESSF